MYLGRSVQDIRLVGKNIMALNQKTISEVHVMGIHHVFDRTGASSDVDRGALCCQEIVDTS